MRLLAIVDHRGRSAPPIETSVFLRRFENPKHGIASRPDYHRSLPSSLVCETASSPLIRRETDPKSSRQRSKQFPRLTRISFPFRCYFLPSYVKGYLVEAVYPWHDRVRGEENRVEAFVFERIQFWGFHRVHEKQVLDETRWKQRFKRRNFIPHFSFVFRTWNCGMCPCVDYSRYG